MIRQTLIVDTGIDWAKVLELPVEDRRILRYMQVHDRCLGF